MENGSKEKETSFQTLSPQSILPTQKTRVQLKRLASPSPPCRGTQLSLAPRPSPAPHRSLPVRPGCPLQLSLLPSLPRVLKQSSGCHRELYPCFMPGLELPSNFPALLPGVNAHSVPKPHSGGPSGQALPWPSHRLEEPRHCFSRWTANPSKATQETPPVSSSVHKCPKAERARTRGALGGRALDTNPPGHTSRNAHTLNARRVAGAFPVVRILYPGAGVPREPKGAPTAHCSRVPTTRWG